MDRSHLYHKCCLQVLSPTAHPIPFHLLPGHVEHHLPFPKIHYISLRPTVVFLKSGKTLLHLHKVTKSKPKQPLYCICFIWRRPYLAEPLIVPPSPIGTPDASCNVEPNSVHMEPLSLGIPNASYNIEPLLVPLSLCLVTPDASV